MTEGTASRPSSSYSSGKASFYRLTSPTWKMDLFRPGPGRPPEAFTSISNTGGARRYPHQYLAPDVEAFHTGNALTAPGSAKASGHNVFTGDLDAAPILPPIIERRLTPAPSSSAAAAPRPVFTFVLDRRPGPPPLELIAQWARDDGRHGEAGTAYVSRSPDAPPETATTTAPRP